MTIKTPTPKPTPQPPGTQVEDFGNGIVIYWKIYN